MTSAKSWLTPKLLVGLAFIIFGTLFTLDNLNVIESGSVSDYWPVVIIAIGLLKLMQGGAKVGGVVLTLLGILLLGDTLDYIRMRSFFPMFFVVAGLFLIWGAFRRPAETGASGGEQAINAFALMGGVERRSASQELLGGELTAIMGGCELDLTNAKPAAKEITIETFALWGGVAIKIPPDWGVVSRVTPIMGAFEDKTRPIAEPKHWLIVNGMAIMGGVEVTNGGPSTVSLSQG